MDMGEEQFMEDLGQQAHFANGQAEEDAYPDPDGAAASSPWWALYAVALLSLAQAVLPWLSSRASQALHPPSAAERERAEEASRLRREQRGMSMQDDFARYAKIDRRVIKIREEIKTMGSARLQEQASAKKALNTTWWIIMGLLYLLLLSSHGLSSPVLFLGGGEGGGDWLLFPLGWLSGPPRLWRWWGSSTTTTTTASFALGLPFWAVCCRQAVGAILAMVRGTKASASAGIKSTPWGL